MEIVGFILLAIAGLSILRLYDTTHDLKERIDALEHLVDKLVDDTYVDGEENKTD